MKYLDKPRVNLSLIGESLSKTASHQLAALCLKAVKQEIQDKTISKNNRRRGRPPSTERILAQRRSVSKKTVDRWLNPEDIQANDHQANQLAKFAYEHYPNRTSAILYEDAFDYVRAVDHWLTNMNNIYGINPCPIFQKADSQNRKLIMEDS